jgi:hypothetical protein
LLKKEEGETEYEGETGQEEEGEGVTDVCVCFFPTLWVSNKLLTLLQYCTVGFFVTRDVNRALRVVVLFGDNLKAPEGIQCTPSPWACVLGCDWKTNSLFRLHGSCPHAFAGHYELCVFSVKRR